MTNPLKALTELGQQVWLDDIRRSYLDDGLLAHLIAEDGLSGVTSNPAIFERAIAASSEYDDAIGALVRAGCDAGAVYESLVVEDIRRAADMLRPSYEGSRFEAGYVSLEVSPHLASDAERTIDEGQRLWDLVDRPNLFIKVPGTEPGLQAIEALITAGINVNVTLLFSVARYDSVIDAYWRGLERRLERGVTVKQPVSVASFFLSRIDTRVDEALERQGSPEALEMQGKAAIASAALAFELSCERYETERWQRLAEHGAHRQQLLWASTGTKNPAYSDIKYVESLVVPGTINTLPMETMAAYRDHGEPAVRLPDRVSAAHSVPAQLHALGVDLDEVSAQLEREGLAKFVEPFDRLMARLEVRCDSGG